MNPTVKGMIVLGGLGLAVVVPLAALGQLARHLWMALEPQHAELAATPPALVVVAALLAGLAVPPFLLAGSVARGALSLKKLSRTVGATGEGRAAGVRFHVVGSEAVVLFVAGLVRPRIYVSQGALRSLSREALEAGLLHERGHQLRADVASRFALHAVASAFGWIPGVRRLVAALTLRSEAAADRMALAAGASRRGLFEAIVAATGTSAANPAAGGTAVERRLRLLAEPSEQGPRGEFVLAAALAGIATMPAGLAQALAVLAPYCGPF